MNVEAKLVETFAKAHPVRVARVLETMTPKEAAHVLQSLVPTLSCELLRFLTPATAARCLERTPEEQSAQVLGSARPEVAASVLRFLKKDHRARVLKVMQPRSREVIRRLLRYPEGTAGALMDPTVLSVAETCTVGEALERVREHPQHAIYYLYLLSENRHLLGVATLRELMLASPAQPLRSIARRPVQALSAKSAWQTVVAHPGWRHVHALPVIETDGQFVGVVRYESVRALEQRLLAQSPDDDAARTGAALGELYGLGLRGLAQWAATLVQDAGQGGTTENAS